MQNDERGLRGRRDDLTVFEVLYVLWGRKKLVGLVVIFLALTALVFGLTRERVYTAESFVSVVPADQSLGRFEREVLVRDVVSPSVTGAVTEDAISSTGWSGSPGEFRSRLRFEYVVREDGPAGILIAFSGETSAQAADTVNTYAELLAGRVEEAGEQGVSGAGVEAEILTRADADELWGSTGVLRYLSIATLAGIVLGGALALLFEGRTKNWRDAQDAEMTLHAPVLGVIPDYFDLVDEDIPVEEGLTERDGP